MDDLVERDGRVPPGYTAESWAAKQAETADFSRRDPFQDPPGERKANAEARLRAAMCIQCADVPDQFALVRRGDLITVIHELIRHRAGHELAIERKQAATRSGDKEREALKEAHAALRWVYEHGMRHWDRPPAVSKAFSDAFEEIRLSHGEER